MYYHKAEATFVCVCFFFSFNQAGNFKLALGLLEISEWKSVTKKLMLDFFVKMETSKSTLCEIFTSVYSPKIEITPANLGEWSTSLYLSDGFYTHMG